MNDGLDENRRNINMDIMDAKELSKIDTIITNLNLYKNDFARLREIYTDMLNDDNVNFLITKISQNLIFKEHFPEFYEKNKYGENVINCQQNNSYHRYGVFQHILYTVEYIDEFQLQISDWQKMLLKWTMFLHDIGKPYVKVIKDDGNDSFAGHDDKSFELSKVILDRFYFNEDEKKIILTLIKFHDKFLNEGEITYDNLQFLAHELNDRKELFYLLIYVKEADARAKSIDVYNKHKLVKNKYIEFANEYFEHTDIKLKVKPDNNVNNAEHLEVQETLSEVEIDNIIQDILLKRRISLLFQPIIDIKEKYVYGYEIYSLIEGQKNLDIAKFLRYSQNNNKYDKVQQILFLNAIEKFEQIVRKESNNIFVNIDLESYENYINKPRIYDLLERNKVAIEINRYDKYDLSSLQEKIDKIREKKGKVVLDHFGIGNINLDSLYYLNVDFIKPDISLIKDIEKDDNKRSFINMLYTFCISKNIELLIIGVETKEQYEVIKKMGIRYVQGYYFAYPEVSITPINKQISELLTKVEDDMITT